MLSLLAAAAFTLVERADPITGEQQSFYGIEQEGDILGVACEVDSNEASIVVVPSRYQGVPAAGTIFAWSPRADSRFPSMEAAEQEAWHFGKTNLTYIGPGFGGVNKLSARWLDHLTRNTEFSIRYEAWPDDVRTITFRYTIDPVELSNFIERCGDQALIRRMQAFEMGRSKN